MEKGREREGGRERQRQRQRQCERERWGGRKGNCAPPRPVPPVEPRARVRVRGERDLRIIAEIQVRGEVT